MTTREAVGIVALASGLAVLVLLRVAWLAVKRWAKARRERRRRIAYMRRRQ